MSKYHPFGAQTYNLAGSISSTATSITLSSFLEPVTGTPYTMVLLNTDIVFATIAPKTTSSEFISFTGITQNADGTATLTGVTRGLAKKSPFTTDSAYKLPHAGQTQFIISDAPQVFEEYVTLHNAETIDGVKTFSVSPLVPTGGTGTQAANATDIANAITGASGTATNTTFGTVKLSVAAASGPNPIVVGDNDTRVPTQLENDALVGTNGIPSSADPYVTNTDTSNGRDQAQTTQNATTKVGEANATGKQNKLAQSIISGTNLTTGVSLYKSADTGTFTGTVTISLQADTTGSPSGVALATVTLNNAAWIALPVGEFSAIFSSAFATVVGTTYWVVIETSTSDNSNHPNLGTNSAGGYTSGSVKYDNTTDGWVAIATIDLYFITMTTNASKVVRANATGFVAAFTPYATDGGSNDAYEITFPGIIAYQTGQVFSFKAATANTTGATLNVNNLGVKNIFRYIAGTLGALLTGDIISGQMIQVEYDGTQFQMLSPSAASPGFQSGVVSKEATDASTTQVIPHGLGVTPKYVRLNFMAAITAASNTWAQANAVYNGTTQSSLSSYMVAAGNLVAAPNFILNTASGANTQTGVITFDATNINIAWTKTNSPGGSYNGIWEAFS